MPEHLAAAQSETDIVETVRRRQRFDLQDVFAELDLPLGEHLGDVALDHQTAIALQTSRRSEGGDVEAVAQHGDVVAQFLDLVEVMRDVDDGHAFVAQAADQTEEDFGLASHQRRGRLVEHQHLRLMQQRAGDLDDLSFGGRKFADQGIFGQVHPEIIGENLAGAAAAWPDGR